MKRLSRMWLHIFAVIAVMVGGLKAQAPPADFFVAPNGDDKNPGTEAQPFATLQRARDAGRELKTKRKGPIALIVRGGKYYLEKTLVLTAEDSGTRESPIIYQAYPGETPVLSGGVKVIGWKPYKGKILQGKLPDRKVSVSEARLLTFNGRLMMRSRWPKFDANVNPFWGVRAHLEGPAEPGSMIAFKYKPGDFPTSIAKPEEAELNLECGHPGPWANCVLPVASIDRQNRIVTLQLELWHSEDDNFKRYRHMPFYAGQGFVLENVLEELDQPGEWYLDSKEGTVYFWPPEELTKESEVVIPRLSTLIDLEGVSYITLSGFTFTETTSGQNMHRFGLEGYGAMFPVRRWKYCGESVHLKDTQHCTIEKSRFYALGGNAVYLEGYNLKDRIRRNTFSYVGANGVSLLGTKENLPMFNEVLDNYFDHTGWILYYTAAVFSGMSNGNLFAHNTIHDLPHHGINLSTNGYGRNVVEFNDLRRTTLATNDTGAINTWMDEYEMPYPDNARVYVKREAERSGHVIRYNYMSDAQQGLYLDDWTSNCFIYGNIITHTRNGMTVHGGKNNVIENNIILNTVNNAIGYYSCCPGRPEAVNMVAFGWGNRFRNNVIYLSGLADLLHFNPQGPDGQKLAPKFLLFQFWRVPAELEYMDREVGESDYNIFFSRAGAYYVQDKDRGIQTLDQWREWGYDAHSIVADPLFVDADHGDYHLKPESPAFKLGFQQIPLKEVGVREQM